MKKSKAEKFSPSDIKQATDMTIINKIQFIRTKNNQAWMDILRCAMSNAPEETKVIMAAIAKNDAEITELTKELADAL